MPILSSGYVSNLNDVTRRNKDRQVIKPKPPVAPPFMPQTPIFATTGTPTGRGGTSPYAGNIAARPLIPSGVPGHVPFPNQPPPPRPVVGEGIPNFPMNSPVLNPEAELNAIGSNAQSEYDRLMNMFQGFMNEGDISYDTINPVLGKYSRSGELDRALKAVEEWYRTGGLSEAEQANIRERGIAPIRAVYANAARNLDRQRALQGGYSPSYTAASTRMAREQGELQSAANTKINADLAEMLLRNREMGLSRFADLAGQESAARNAFEASNTAARNRAAELNAQGLLTAKTANQGKKSQALQNMLSLYGTTPGKSKLLSDNVMNNAQLQQEIQKFLSQMGFNREQLSQQGGLGLIDALMRGIT